MRISDERRLKVLIIGPTLDGTDVGEVYSVSQWIKALTAQAEVTVLSSQMHGRGPIQLAYCWAHARRKLHEIAKERTAPIAEEGLTAR